MPVYRLATLIGMIDYDVIVKVSQVSQVNYEQDFIHVNMYI